VAAPARQRTSGHHHHHHGGGGNDHEDSASCRQDNGAKDKADGLHGQAGLVNIQDTTVMHDRRMPVAGGA
jgi:hypothetical protein